jgi:hemolysin activation/secretion protein
VASIEARVPLVRNARWADTLEVAPFLDFGQAWNTRGGTPDPRSISSVGVGLRWGLTLRAWPRLRTHVEVYWGHALRDVPTPGGDLQDDGVHFQVVVGFF